MTFEIPLVDALSIQADCMYLSDLRYLDKWQRVRPVSYTHLDVYKRQE